MGGYPIVMIEETTVDGYGCEGDEEEDRILVDEEERVSKNTVFWAWRNVMRRMISLYKVLPLPLCRSTFSGVVWSTYARLISRHAGKFTGISLPSFPSWGCEDRTLIEPYVLYDKNTRDIVDSANKLKDQRLFN